MRHILVIFIVGLLMNGCAIVKSYDSYSGKVVDLSTNEPIQGAAVLAIYSTYGLIDHTEIIDATEVVTDEKGHFRIPEKLVFTFQVMSRWNLQPQIFIYKPEYGCYPKGKKEKIFKYNDTTDMRVPSSIRFVQGHYSDSYLPAGKPVIVALDKLTNEERRQYGSCFTHGVPFNKMREMKKLENMDRVDRGYRYDLKS